MKEFVSCVEGWRNCDRAVGGGRGVGLELIREEFAAPRRAICRESGERYTWKVVKVCECVSFSSFPSSGWSELFNVFMELTYSFLLVTSTST
jgi:hypothetical protein